MPQIWAVLHSAEGWTSVSQSRAPLCLAHDPSLQSNCGGEEASPGGETFWCIRATCSRRFAVVAARGNVSKQKMA